MEEAGLQTVMQVKGWQPNAFYIYQIFSSPTAFS